jgi:hypothetical protein
VFELLPEEVKRFGLDAFEQLGVDETFLRRRGIVVRVR